MRPLYRACQFWRALTAAPTAEDLSEVCQALPTPLMALFLRLQPDEQAHSFWIYRQLRAENETDVDLLTAALLHDIGKSCYPLHLWERVLNVLGRACFPRQVKDWGQGDPCGWKRPFVVAQQHPVWGAAMAVGLGASPRAAELIRHHHAAPEDPVLLRLQLMDNES
jgi:putative nucleotidyltransferase with HDIG domain